MTSCFKKIWPLLNPLPSLARQLHLCPNLLPFVCLFRSCWYHLPKGSDTTSMGIARPIPPARCPTHTNTNTMHVKWFKIIFLPHSWWPLLLSPFCYVSLHTPILPLGTDINYCILADNVPHIFLTTYGHLTWYWCHFKA